MNTEDPKQMRDPLRILAPKPLVGCIRGRFQANYSISEAWKGSATTRTRGNRPSDYWRGCTTGRLSPVKGVTCFGLPKREKPGLATFGEVPLLVTIKVLFTLRNITQAPLRINNKIFLSYYVLSISFYIKYPLDIAHYSLSTFPELPKGLEVSILGIRQADNTIIFPEGWRDTYEFHFWPILIHNCNQSSRICTLFGLKYRVECLYKMIRDMTGLMIDYNLRPEWTEEKNKSGNSRMRKETTYEIKRQTFLETVEYEDDEVREQDSVEKLSEIAEGMIESVEGGLMMRMMFKEDFNHDQPSHEYFKAVRMLRVLTCERRPMRRDGLHIKFGRTSFLPLVAQNAFDVSSDHHTGLKIFPWYIFFLPSPFAEFFNPVIFPTHQPLHALALTTSSHQHLSVHFEQAHAGQLYQNACSTASFWLVRLSGISTRTTTIISSGSEIVVVEELIQSNKINNFVIISSLKIIYILPGIGISGVLQVTILNYASNPAWEVCSNLTKVVPFFFVSIAAMMYSLKSIRNNHFSSYNSFFESSRIYPVVVRYATLYKYSPKFVFYYFLMCFLSTIKSKILCEHGLDNCLALDDWKNKEASCMTKFFPVFCFNRPTNHHPPRISAILPQKQIQELSLPQFSIWRDKRTKGQQSRRPPKSNNNQFPRFGILWISHFLTSIRGQFLALHFQVPSCIYLIFLV
ncbi:hypothetical protein VP01_2126g3 [Puccinia sorghi]|uniref:Uncharacterized protein n=1 Tax=Puccinia sorghi TaxID=27349 RepID=A0A0L6V9X3_9BASI|nr:hypothetical protein VP01_2126g3 [Puccinia sorghi]